MQRKAADEPTPVANTEFDEVLLDIATGLSVGKSLKKHNKSSSHFYTRLNADAELEKQYARAKDLALNALADEMLDIADGNDESDVRRVRIDTRKWLLSKLKPKIYGDRVQQEHSGAIVIQSTPGEEKTL